MVRLTAFANRSPAATNALIALLPVLLVLGLVYAFHTGNRGSDDLGYAELAYSILDPSQSMGSQGHHSGRVGMTLPLTILFLIFGVRDWCLAVLPLLCTLGTAVLLTRLTQQLYGRLAAAIAACLYAVFPPTIYLATWYLPEPIVNFELTLASVLFFAGMQRENGAAVRYYICGLLIGLAYLTTEVGALMVAVIAAFLLVQRRLAPVHFWVAAGALTVLFGELIGHTLIHGNPLYRFSFGDVYLEDPMLVAQNADLAYRLLKSYPSLFVYLNANLGGFGPLLLIGAAYGLLRFRRCAYFVIWAAVIFLFYNFMTVSMEHYIVLPADARLIDPACIPLIVLTGAALAELLRSSARMQRALWRKLVGAAVALLLAFEVVVAVASLDFDQRYPGKSTMVARNVEVASARVRGIEALDLISDARSVELFRFYRRFSSLDSYAVFDTGTPVAAAPFVLLNMPVLHERELTGSAWRANDLVGDASELERGIAQRCALLFSENIDYGSPVFDNVFGKGQTARLLKVQRQFDRNPAYTEVRLFRCASSGTP